MDERTIAMWRTPRTGTVVSLKVVPSFNDGLDAPVLVTDLPLDKNSVPQDEQDDERYIRTVIEPQAKRVSQQWFAVRTFHILCIEPKSSNVEEKPQSKG